MKVEKCYKVWNDGFSPIGFALLQNELTAGSEKDFIKDILAQVKGLSSKFGKCYIIINLSLVSFSHEKLHLLKDIVAKFSKTNIGAVAFIGFHGMKFRLNLTDAESVGITKVKFFEVFEKGLEFINEEIVNQSSLETVY